MTRVLIHTHSPQRHIAKLTEAYPTVQFDSCTVNSALPQVLDRFQPDAMFTVNMSSDVPYPRDAVLNCASLRWLSVGGSGTDHLGPWDADKLVLTNSAGVAAGIMSEYVLGCMLHFNMDVPGLIRDQDARVWNDRQMIPIAGKTLLIVGLGSTGRVLAQMAKAMGMTVIGTRANPRATPNCDEVHGADSLPLLWPRADFIAICTPRLPSTLGLVNADAFGMMKPEAVLINVARGGVVDETALGEALTSGTIRGAAMDVFSVEPLPADSPLWVHPNLLISPHCSGVYEGWEENSVEMFSANLGRYLKGEALQNIVDPARGY